MHPNDIEERFIPGQRVKEKEMPLIHCPNPAIGLKDTMKQWWMQRFKAMIEEQHAFQICSQFNSSINFAESSRNMVATYSNSTFSRNTNTVMMARLTFFVLWVTVALATVTAKNTAQASIGSTVEETMGGVMATPDPEKEPDQETCFTTKEFIEFIENIRKGEVRLPRFAGSYKCVAKRLFTAKPRRAFFRESQFVRCFDSSLVITTVVHCANAVHQEETQPDNETLECL